MLESKIKKYGQYISTHWFYCKNIVHSNDAAKQTRVAWTIVSHQTANKHQMICAMPFLRHGGEHGTACVPRLRSLADLVSCHAHLLIRSGHLLQEPTRHSITTHLTIQVKPSRTELNPPEPNTSSEEEKSIRRCSDDVFSRSSAHVSLAAKQQ